MRSRRRRPSVPRAPQAGQTGPGPSCAVSFRENHWRGLADHHTMAPLRGPRREREHGLTPPAGTSPARSWPVATRWTELSLTELCRQPLAALDDAPPPETGALIFTHAGTPLLGRSHLAGALPTAHGAPRPGDGDGGDLPPPRSPPLDCLKPPGSHRLHEGLEVLLVLV